MKNSMRKRTRFFILFLIAILGLALRSYNLNFPAIGYHNMKENEYLSMAQEMVRTGEFFPSISYYNIKEKGNLSTVPGMEDAEDFITRRIYFYNAFEDDPKMKIYPQLPLVSYQILISWKLLGENLWGPRLFNVLFGVLSIFVVYLIGQLLFNDVRLALFCSLLLAFMPLSVFFSRNLQPESPAFFFMLLGEFFYLKFASSLKKKHLLLGGFSFCLSWLYKFNFFFGALPLIFYLPFRRIWQEKKQVLKYIPVLFLSYSIILLAVLWLKSIGQWEFGYQQTLGRIKLLDIFTPSYWKSYGRVIWWYTRGENYTLVFALLSITGIISAFIRRRGLLNRYIIGWSLIIIPFSMLFSDFINQHNYYQMPFLGLVCISSAYAVSLGSVPFRKIFKKDTLIYLMVVLVAVSAPLVYDSISRMFGTVFLGVDVAGESLREFTKPEERIFLRTYAQGYAIARYARRYVGWISDLADFKEKEKKFNIRYICFYPAEFSLELKDKNPELFNYIQGNYQVKEVGLLEEPNKLFYIILEKGKGSDPEAFLKSFSGRMQVRAFYNLFGRYLTFYILRPPIQE